MEGETIRLGSAPHLVAFYRCSSCRSLIEHSQEEIEKHKEWHEKLLRATLLASPFGGIFGSAL